MAQFEKQRVIMVRNDTYQPDLSREGVYMCPMPQPPQVKEGKVWHAGLAPHERLYYHQTMASVRSSNRFHQYPIIPRDSLDLQLRSRYDHSREAFPEKVDSVLQRETCSAVTSWSQATSGKEPGAMIMQHINILNNKIAVPAPRVAVLDHPLRISGVKEKIHPHSVKLICSGVHNQLVNNGFSRQSSDGNFFRY